MFCSYGAVSNIDGHVKAIEHAPDGGGGVMGQRAEPIRALLVDDDQQVRMIIGDILSDMGLAVYEAADGSEALPLLITPGLQLLVTDINMPGMDGWTLAERAREVRPELSVIYITGFYSDLARPVLGAEVVRKPFSYETLSRAVQFVVR